MIDQFTKTITIKGTKLNKGILGIINQTYGKITNKKETNYRKILTAITKAKHQQPNKKTIKVTINNKTKLKDIFQKKKDNKNSVK